MKPQEILLASTVLALVAGAGAALATRALGSGPARSETGARAVEGPTSAPAAGPADSAQTLEELRRGQTALLQRVAALEARLAESASARTAAAAEIAPDDAPSRAARGAPTEAPQALELTPAFVESVGLALERIQQKEEAEREARRKELQAQRVEERVARLQQELGLNNRQASDLRTALLAQDDKREALFTAMRDGQGDPRDARDGFRTLREETHASLQTFLSAEQYRLYLESEEAEFGRRGPGDFGGPPGRPTDGGFERRGR